MAAYELAVHPGQGRQDTGISCLVDLGRWFNDSRCPLYGDMQDITVADFLAFVTDSEDMFRTFHCQTMLTMVLPWHRASQGKFAYILAFTMRANCLCYPADSVRSPPLSCEP
ncbi:MAG: hypothetical protein SWK76_11275 [Actinomycetota bacterium]|nr:hypothetical protein [Actinomycetota bacterium]